LIVTLHDGHRLAREPFVTGKNRQEAARRKGLAVPDLMPG